MAALYLFLGVLCGWSGLNAADLRLPVDGGYLVVAGAVFVAAGGVIAAIQDASRA